MWVGEIDVHDDAQVKAFWEAGREADESGREYPTYWSLRSAMVAFRAEGNSVEQHPLAAIEDGEVVGVNQVVFPLLDNTHISYVEPLVPPSHRNRGVGSTLVRAALDLSRDAGRDTIVGQANMPLDADSDGARFLHKHGFSTAIVDLHRVLDLPVSTRRLTDLAVQAAPYHEQYRFVSFDDEVPDELMDGFCELQMAFNDEVPSGDLDIEAEMWDEDRVRKTEARLRKQGAHETRTVVLSSEGTMVALTEMKCADSKPEMAYQGGTLVLSPHRGHRLGLASKVVNLRRFQQRFPAVTTVHSWNAEENGPMGAINDVLGFRGVERLAEMQLKLDAEPGSPSGV
ncbi:MAG: GNAT family N-acetyltransferase [Propionibacteriales bacterium]|nr:GNAT family N-acetyltransferase [Propionibacteriales bacterium]